ncbi:MAG: PqiC family protein [Azonexus sp.]|nr:PqiC family protein [Azonexus sp.]
MRMTMVVLAAALLGGCFLAGKRGGETGMTLHDFGTPPPLKEVRARPAKVALEIKAPQWLDGLGVNYRLSYADASQLREYTRSRWAGPPTQLVAQRLMQTLDLTAAGQVSGKCVLRIELSEFSQIFASPNDSIGLLQGKALWLDAGRRSLAERPWSISSPAATADARGGVAALKTVVDRLAGELLDWEQKLTTSGRLRACFD